MNKRYAAAVAAVAVAAVISGSWSFASAMRADVYEPVPRASLKGNNHTLRPDQLPGGGWRQVMADWPTSCTTPDPALDYERGMRTMVRKPGEVAHSWWNTSSTPARGPVYMERTADAFVECAGEDATVQTFTEPQLPPGSKAVAVTDTVACAPAEPCAPHRLYVVMNKGLAVAALELQTAEPVAAEDALALVRSKLVGY